jgi:hypothetical protein
MVNIISKKCIYSGCKKRPNFNTEGETKPLYCGEHKLEKMIDIKHQKCIHAGCKIRPTYNIDGKKTPLYCNSHKLEGMLNVINIRCIHPNCKKTPTYNTKGKTKPLYCNSHKLEWMLNVIDNRCIHPDCKKIPTYNKESETKALYCSEHKLVGMSNVKNKKCIHPGCKIIAHFNNKKGNGAIYCTKHKTQGMEDVKNKKCNYKGCKIIPSYNTEGAPALYCFTHKQPGMINVVSKHCKTHLCSTQVNEKYDGYCLHCYMNLFPDKPVCRNYKTKEYSVVEYVKTNYTHPWISDKQIDGGCSRRRPDLLLDLIDQVLIIEVDENQHIEYDCSCENKRLMELSRDLAHRPIVFIRFNPDDYQKDGLKISSCWGTDQKGICVVKKSKKEEWTQRLHALGETIEYWITHSTDKMIEIIQLFY